MIAKFLTAKELAARWNFKSEKKVYKMKDTGKIPFTMIDGAVRFPLEEIEKYERMNTTLPKEEMDPDSP